MMTTRQIDIISYFCNHEGWITSEQLSQHFGLNKGTIQAEIRLISEYLGTECQIDVSSRKGFHLEFLTEKARKQIRAESAWDGGRNCLGYRPSSFILYFMFLKGYVTMQELADTFFMSKTAVSLEMETIKRWVKRYGEIRLDVSRVHGLKLCATELRKRVYSSTFGTVNAYRNMPIPKVVSTEYERYLFSIVEILQKILVEKKYLLTGEELRKNSRFIAGSILRSRMGYLLEECEVNALEKTDDAPNGVILDDIIADINDQICKVLEYELTEAEKKSIKMMLRESNVLRDRPAEQEVLSAQAGMTESQKLFEKVEHLERGICRRLGMKTEELFQEKELLVDHLEKMYLRGAAGHVAVNHYGEDIILRNPLEVHLAGEMLPEYFGLEVNKETSFIALFIATAFNRFRRGLSVLIVCDQNQCVVQHIKSMFRQYGVVPISRWDVMPSYAFEEGYGKCESYDIFLTTDKETLLLDDGFYLIPPILTSEDILEMNGFLQEKQMTALQRQRNRIKEQYLQILYPDNGSEEVEEILSDSRGHEGTYHSFGHGNLYICRIGREEKTGIRMIHLKTGENFRNKKIRCIIDVRFRQGDTNVLEFFDTVSELLLEL